MGSVFFVQLIIGQSPQHLIELLALLLSDRAICSQQQVVKNMKVPFDVALGTRDPLDVKQSDEQFQRLYEVLIQFPLMLSLITF